MIDIAQFTHVISGRVAAQEVVVLGGEYTAQVGSNSYSTVPISLDSRQG